MSGTPTKKPAAVSTGIVEGRVVGITDGDTITVLDSKKAQHKIRLSGIDAPERKQAFGTVARTFLGDKVHGRSVVVEFDKRDRYRRIVGKIMLDGKDMNLLMIRAGLAWHYKKYANEQSAEDRERYAQAEREARQARRSLWRDPNPVPPWAFRRR